MLVLLSPHHIQMFCLIYEKVFVSEVSILVFGATKYPKISWNYIFNKFCSRQKKYTH